jgi:hypothetical protein
MVQGPQAMSQNTKRVPRGWSDSQSIGRGYAVSCSLTKVITSRSVHLAKNSHIAAILDGFEYSNIMVVCSKTYYSGALARGQGSIACHVNSSKKIVNSNPSIQIGSRLSSE